MAEAVVSERYCSYCAAPMLPKRWVHGDRESPAQFARRRYCSNSCSARDKAAHQLPGSDPSGVRRNARRRCPPGPCTVCGVMPGKIVHHVDHDYLNNDVTNLARVCAPCHRKLHGPIANRVRGERSPFAKLTEDAVRQIRAAYRPHNRQGNSARALARRYGVNHQTVLAIVHGQKWTHVEQSQAVSA